MRQEFYYPSCGGGMIHGCRWMPEGAPRAILQLVHGIAEHIARYDAFATFMAQNGFLVVAEDHMGHGASIGEGETAGYFEGGWERAVADCYQLLLDTRRDHPHLPYVLLGHSMGSFLVRTMLIRYPEAPLTAVVLSGTAWMPAGVLNAGLATAKLICKLGGERNCSKLLNAMMFGSYNGRIHNPRTTHDWLTRDAACVDAYVADPLCGFVVTSGLARDMLGGMRGNQQPQKMEKMNKRLPVLFLAGDADPVGDYGKGVRCARAAFEKAGMERTDLLLYPQGRHEMLNETNKLDVYADLLGWIGQNL